MRLLKTLFKPQLPKASHYKRDKEMREGNIATHGWKIYIEKILRTLSTKTVHRIDLRIVILKNSPFRHFTNLLEHYETFTNNWQISCHQSCLKLEYVNVFQYIHESLNKN